MDSTGDMEYLLLQMLNGVQLGLLMFLLAAGLTLTFGIMDLVNLAHGSLYMMGAYFAWTCIGWTNSFVLGALLALPATFAARHGRRGGRACAGSMRRDHLDQVLATFGLILFFNELVRVIWGPAGKSIAVPPFLSRTVEILPGMPYPAYRFAIIVVGAAGGAAARLAGDAHAARHADPRRRLQPAHDRARSASTSSCCSAWCSASARCSPASPA